MPPFFQANFLNSTQSRFIGATYLAFLAFTVALSFFKRAAVIIAVLLPVTFGTLFNMYVVNCTVNGNCTIYAWLTAALAVLSLVSMAATLTFLKDVPASKDKFADKDTHKQAAP